MSEKVLEITNKLIAEYKPEKIILFGSFAWGNPNTDSDIDLFLIKESDKDLLEREREVKRIIFGSGIPVDVIVYTPEQFERRKKIGDPFVMNIVNNGKLLYESAAR